MCNNPSIILKNGIKDFYLKEKLKESKFELTPTYSSWLIIVIMGIILFLILVISVPFVYMMCTHKEPISNTRLVTEHIRQIP